MSMVIEIQALKMKCHRDQVNLNKTNYRSVQLNYEWCPQLEYLRQQTYRNNPKAVNYFPKRKKRCNSIPTVINAVDTDNCIGSILFL